MATTADYLNKLIGQKNSLADNLVTKGIEATHDETLGTLIPKVLEISGGGGNDIMDVINSFPDNPIDNKPYLPYLPDFLSLSIFLKFDSRHSP